MYFNKILFNRDLWKKLGKCSSEHSLNKQLNKELSVGFKRAQYKSIIDDTVMSNKIDKYTWYAGYGISKQNLTKNVDDLLQKVNMKQVKHLFWFGTNDDVNEQPIKDGIIANSKTIGKNLTTVHYDIKSDVYTCENDSTIDLSVFENMNSFNQKKIELVEIEKVKDLSINGNNLKSKKFLEYGGSEDSFKKYIKKHGKFFDFDN